MSKPRFTPDEHDETGRQLAFLHNCLVEISTRVANAYPKAGPDARAVEQLRAAVRSLDRARSSLDGAFAREHPDAFATTAYYPHPGDRSWLPPTPD